MQIYSVLCKCTTDLSLVKVSWRVEAFAPKCRKKGKVSALCNGDFFREQISLVPYSRGYVTEHFANTSWRDLLNPQREKLVGLFNRNLFSAEIRCCSWSKKKKKKVFEKNQFLNRKRQQGKGKFEKCSVIFFCCLNFRKSHFSVSWLFIESHLQKYIHFQWYL